MPARYGHSSIRSHDAEKWLGRGRAYRQLQLFRLVCQNDPLWQCARALYSGLVFRCRHAGTCARQSGRGLAEDRMMR
jgi:hypothetical protein